MITWVLESNVFSEQCFDDMVSHFKAESIPYHIIHIIPFAHTIDGKVPNIDGPCVAYGSIGIQKVCVDNNWIPGIWTGNLLDEDKVSDALGDMYLNHDYINTSMTRVIEDTPWDLFFIKPNTDTKEFAGTIMER